MSLFLKRMVASACLLVIASPSFANDAERTKVETNKFIDMLDFSPNFGTTATVSETEPNNDCASPDPADIFVDEVAGAIDVAGDEDWFVFEASAGDCITFATNSREGSSTDTQLYVYDAANCTDPSAWIAFDDDDGPGLFSLIESFEIPADGTYYLRVKHFSSSSGTGAYSLSGSSTVCPQPPANDLCENAMPVQCNSTITGTTDLAGNDLEDLVENCVPFGADGPDVFYEVVVPAGEQIDVVLTPTGWDPALWLVLDCNDELSCVAGADTGFFDDPEMVSWVNDTGSDQTIYIVPDSYTASVSGEFSLSISCDAVVSGDEASWGALKSRF